MRSRRLLVTSLCLSLVAAACGSEGGVTGVSSESHSDSTSAGTSTPTDETPTDTATPDTPDTGGTESTAPADGDPFGWQSFADNIETGSLRVPIDYNDPSKGEFDLFVARHLADPNQRIGSLLVNPGGPGFGGSTLALQPEGYFSPDLIDRFDIIGWDPRGTDLTTPAIDCIEDYDRYFDSTDITPDDDAERQQIIDLAKEFEDKCVQKNAEILQYVGTNNAARDMDQIRRALGEDKISYFGFSYGSELGATWATLFPDTVRAAVLDGAVDPNADLVQGGLDQAKGFEAAVDTFLARCSADSDCAFHNGGDAEGAFDQLMADIDEHPLPTVAGRPDLTRGAALQGVSQAMYLEALWPQLEQALAAAQQGDGSGLLELYDAYYRRNQAGKYDNKLEGFQTIACMDTTERPTVAEEDANAPLYNQVAPRMQPGTTGSYMCTFYPETQDPRAKITGAGAGPIVVVGTTGDPATPLAGSQKMADALEDGVFVTVVGNNHTGYGTNRCSVETIDDFLIDLKVPNPGTRCE
jgi:pimeloyl-ACP methyl ester carboxylesterase